MHSDLDVHSLDVGYAGAKLCVSTMSDTKTCNQLPYNLGGAKHDPDQQLLQAMDRINWPLSSFGPLLTTMEEKQLASGGHSGGSQKLISETPEPWVDTFAVSWFNVLLVAAARHSMVVAHTPAKRFCGTQDFAKNDLSFRILRVMWQSRLAKVCRHRKTLR